LFPSPYGSIIAVSSSPTTDAAALEVYLLGSVDFEEVRRWQRRFIYEVSGDRSRGVLVLCEHPPLITVGRDGSRAHILADDAELRARKWPVRWVNRGGGCTLHLQGQLAVYSVLALDRLGLTVPEYVARLSEVLQTVVRECDVAAAVPQVGAGVCVKDRMIGQVGVAVREWVSYYGAVLNVNPDLEPYRRVECSGSGEPPMTSLERERRGPVRPALVRQRLVEAFAERFGFARTTPFHNNPFLPWQAPTDAVASRPG
jgi:lipoyl(octanoyl) transferase